MALARIVEGAGPSSVGPPICRDGSYGRSRLGRRGLGVVSGVIWRQSGEAAGLTTVRGGYWTETPGVRGPWLGRITLLGPARRIPAR